MKITVISSCTKAKTCPALLKQEDFPLPKGYTGFDVLHSTFAAFLYKGRQHTLVANGVNLLRKAGLEVNWKILSAGYGLIDETTKLVSYDCTLTGKKKDEIIAWSERMEIRQSFKEAVAGSDYVILLLGKEYLQALQLHKQIEPVHRDKLIILTNDRHYYMYGKAYPTPQSDCKLLRCMMTDLKGMWFNVAAIEIGMSRKADKVFSDFEGFMWRIRGSVKRGDLLF